MAKGQQIKHVLIDINTKGAAKVTTAVKAINTELENIQDNSVKVGGFLKGPIKSLETLISRTRSLNTTFESAAKGAQSINKAMTGDAKATKRIEGYITNLEFVTLVLKDVAKQASLTSTALASMNDTSGLSSIVAELKKIESNTGKASARIKQARDNITDLDVTTNRMGEELIDFSDGFDRATKSQGKFNKKSKDTITGMTKMTKAGNGSARSFSKMAFGMNPVTSLYASIAINVYALSEAFRVLNEAANFARLEDSLVSFSAGVSGLNVKELAAEMSVLSGSVLSVKESMQFAVKGAAFNFTAEQLKNLTRGARNASMALGLNMTDALDRVMRGISKQEIELFDELGVVTRLTPAFKAYADSINKTVDELSDYERQLALTIEVQGQLDKRFGSIEGKVTGFERLSKATKDLTTAFLVSVTSALDPYAESLAGLFSGFIEETPKAKASLDSMSTAMKALGREIPNLGIATIAYGQALKGMSEVTEQATTNVNELKESLTGPSFGAYVAGALAGVAAIGLLVAGVAALKVAVVALAPVIYGAVGAAVVTLLTLSAPILAIVAGLVAIGAAAGAAFAYFSNEKENQEKVKQAIVGTNRARQATLDQLKIEAMFVEKGINMSQAKADGLKKYEDKYLAGVTKINTALKNRLLTQAEADAEMKKLSKEMGSAQEAVAAAVEAVGASMKATDESTAKAALTLNSLGVSMSVVKDKMTPVLTELDKFINLSYAGGEALGYQKAEVAKLFEEFKKNNNVDMSFTNPAALEEEILAIRKINYELERRNTIISQESAVSGQNKSSILEAELAKRTQINDRLKRQGKFTQVLTDAEDEKLLVLKSQLDIIVKKERLERKLLELNNKQSIQKINQLNTYMSATASAEQETKNATDIFDVKLSDKNLSLEGARLLTEKFRLEQQVLFAKEKQAKITDKMNHALHLNNDLRKEQAELAVDKQHERTMSGTNLGVASFGNVQQQESLSADIGKAKADVEAKGEGFLGTDAYEAANAQILQMENALNRVKELSPRAELEDWKAGMEGIASIPGLDSMTSQVLSASAGLGEALFNISENFGKNSEAMMESVGQAITIGAEIVGAVMSKLSEAKIAGFDREIEAEKRKDGKSKESLAKIKKLEAQKIKEKAKADKASVVMSTATAVIRAISDLGPIAGPVAGVGIAAMGMFQLAQIDKAAAGQVAGLGGGPTASMSITGGNRDNSMDVSKSANAGEFAFLGGSGSTPGRAGGGYSEAGASIIVGERGPEMITPQVPVNVATAGESTKQAGPSIVFSPSISIDAMDGQSILDRSPEIFDAFEQEFNARFSKSVENL